MKYTRECEETADRILQHVTAHWRDLTPEGIETLGEARRLLQRIAVDDSNARVVEILYTNDRGETDRRRVEPQGIRFGTTFGCQD